jgi:hypothetical protein
MTLCRIKNTKTAAIFSRLFFLGFVNCICVVDIYAETYLSISPTVDYVFYREFSVTGETLDTETGFLPGLKSSIHYDVQHYSFYAEGYYGSSTIEYDGHLQSGSVYQTDSEMIKSSLRMGGNWHQPYYSLGVYLGRNNWDRHILSSNNVPKLSEYYSWDSLGVQYTYNNDRLSINAGLAHLFNAGVKVDLVEQGGGFPYVAMPNGVSFSTGFNWDLDAYFPAWSFQSSFEGHYFTRSDITYSQNYLITEPENVTFQLSIGFSYLIEL